MFYLYLKSKVPDSRFYSFCLYSHSRYMFTTKVFIEVCTVPSAQRSAYDSAANS